MSEQYTVIGATRGPGLGVFLKLAQQGASVTGIARDPGRIRVLETILKDQNIHSAKLIQADLQQDCTFSIPDLRHSTHLIGASRAPHIKKLACKMPHLQRILALGSTRIFTRFPDQRMAEMQAMVDFLAGQTVPYTILHPSIIYGGTGYNNIERIQRILKYWPLIPLPAGGKALIQPVHNDDVVHSVLAALANPGAINKTLVISGPNPLSYSDFIQAIARDKGSKAVCFNLPMPVLKVLALATRLVPFLPSITSDEILRLLEDKNFSVDDMKSVLNIDPMPLSEGLKIFYPLEEAGEHFARF